MLKNHVTNHYHKEQYTLCNVKIIKFSKENIPHKLHYTGTNTAIKM